jgi:5-methylcytosine-specific restriction enzyme subunit McrC
MKPDLLFLRNEQPVYVGDAKYKVIGDITGVDSDLYQLLAYTTALGLPEGVLIYAQSDEAITPAVVQVSKVGKRLHIRRIDLRGNAAAIRWAVDELAAWIASRSATGAST